MLNFNLRVVLVSALFTGLAINAYACGDDGGGGNSGPACTAFQTSSCFCPTGQQGTQQCLADGSGFAACVCGQGGTGGSAGFAGTGGVGGGSGECGGGETCNATPLNMSVCGPPGTSVPPACTTSGQPCGPSGGTCQALGPLGTLCVKQCQGAGGTGGTGGVSGTGGTGGVSGTGGTGGVSGTGGTGGVSGTGGTGGVSGTGGTGGVSGTGGTGGVDPGCPGGTTCTDIGAFLQMPGLKVCAAGLFPPACDGSMMCPSLPGATCAMNFCLKPCQ